MIDARCWFEHRRLYFSDVMFVWNLTELCLEELALASTPNIHQFRGKQYPYADTNDLNPWRMKWSCSLFLAQNDYGVMNHQRFYYRYFSVELELFFVRRLGILTQL